MMAELAFLRQGLSPMLQYDMKYFISGHNLYQEHEADGSEHWGYPGE